MCCDWQSIGAWCYKALVEKLLTDDACDVNLPPINANF